MSADQIEKKIRAFFVEDMVKLHVSDVSTTAELDLDSLDQTELRVFLEEEYGIDVAEFEDIDPFSTIQGIVEFIDTRSSADSL